VAEPFQTGTLIVRTQSQKLGQPRPAGQFGGLAQALRGRGRGHEPSAVGHFCIRLLFCLFAEAHGGVGAGPAHNPRSSIFA
jgi:hypothetical protein